MFVKLDFPVLEWDDLFLIINRLPLSIYWHAVLYLYTNRGCWAEPAQDSHSHSYESLKSSFVARTALSCLCSKVSLEYLGKINQFTNLLRRVTKLNTADGTAHRSAVLPATECSFTFIYRCYIAYQWCWSIWLQKKMLLAILLSRNNKLAMCSTYT